MAAHPARFINLPAAVVAIVVRKVFDTYTGGYTDVKDLMLPSGFRTLEHLLRFIRFDGMNYYLIGAAATTFIYYLKKFKLLQLVKRRSRESIGCGTTGYSASRLLRRPSLKLNQSLKMLFRRSDRVYPYMKRNSFPNSRRNDIGTRSSAGSFYRTEFTTNSAPPALETLATTPSEPQCPPGSENASAPSLLENTPPIEVEPAPSEATLPATSMPLTIGLNLPPGQSTHLQDIHGNIYDSRTLSMALGQSLNLNQRESLSASSCRSPVFPDTPTSSATFRTLTTVDNCEGDYSPFLEEETDFEPYTPSVIREILPSQIEVFKIPGTRRILGRGRTLRQGILTRTPRRTPRRAKVRGTRRVTRSKRRGSASSSQKRD